MTDFLLQGYLDMRIRSSSCRDHQWFTVIKNMVLWQGFQSMIRSHSTSWDPTGDGPECWVLPPETSETTSERMLLSTTHSWRPTPSSWSSSPGTECFFTMFSAGSWITSTTMFSSASSTSSVSVCSLKCGRGSATLTLTTGEHMVNSDWSHPDLSTEETWGSVLWQVNTHLWLVDTNQYWSLIGCCSRGDQLDQCWRREEAGSVQQFQKQHSQHTSQQWSLTIQTSPVINTNR